MVQSPSSPYPFGDLPEPNLLAISEKDYPVPDASQCEKLWDEYDMFENVRRHSRMVGELARSLADLALSADFAVSVPLALASGLLHDLAKTWCLRHGGSHAMLGASWIVQRTRNYKIAQAAFTHVHWPWTVPEDARILSAPFFVIYADKRVRHDACVTLEERFDDLLLRYGKTEAARAGIRASHAQAKQIENTLSHVLGIKLNEYSLDSGRLVKRA